MNTNDGQAARVRHEQAMALVENAGELLDADDPALARELVDRAQEIAPELQPMGLDWADLHSIIDSAASRLDLVTV